MTYASRLIVEEKKHLTLSHKVDNQLTLNNVFWNMDKLILRTRRLLIIQLIWELRSNVVSRKLTNLHIRKEDYVLKLNILIMVSLNFNFKKKLKKLKCRETMITIT